MLESLKGKKTYIAAVVAVVSAVGAYLMGDMGLDAMVNAVVSAVLAACLRNGIAAK